MAALRAVAVAWFLREDYERIREICDDAMIPAFDQWEAKMRQKIDDLQRQRPGVLIERIIIDPDQLLAFARRRGFAKIDSKVRSEFAAFTLENKHARGH